MSSNAARRIDQNAIKIQQYRSADYLHHPHLRLCLPGDVRRIADRHNFFNICVQGV